MNWKKKLTTTGLATVLIAASTGCPSDPEEIGNDDTPVFEPTLESFEVSPAAVTSGTDVHGDSVQGEVLLEWEAEDAEAILIFANDSELDLSDCAPADGGDCLDGGSLVHEPDEDTTYRIEVLSDADADCEIDDGEAQNTDLCASDSADVEVFAPALLSLDREDDRFPQDEEFAVEFEVENARDFEIGIVGDDGALEEICEIDGSGVCSRPDANSGELTLSGLDSSITLSGWAENGADDDLGMVDVGDVELTLHPEGVPVIRYLRATPAHVPFGGETTLEWETEDSEEIEITSGFSDIIETDLSECSEIDEDGQGSCDVRFQDVVLEDLDSVSFTAVAFSEDAQESDPFEISIVLGHSPNIEEFDVTDDAFRALPADGGDIELMWDIAHDPTHLVLTADGETILDTDDDTGVEFCQSSGPECDLSSDVFAVEDVTEPTTFTLTATSPIGSDSASVNVSVEGAPEILTVTVDGHDVLDEAAVVDAESATLEWTTEDADAAQLARADSPEGGCDSSDADWNDVDDFNEDPSGDFEISGLDQAEECFRLTASEDEAGQSASVTFKIARAPLLTSFDVDPTTTSPGEYVTLSWEAPFASEVGADSPDIGHINADHLENCTEVGEDFQGSCEVRISPGTSASDVTFTLHSIGFDGLESGEESVTVFLGSPPEIDLFCGQAESDDQCGSTTVALDDVEDITLEWELEASNATEFSIVDDGGNVEFETTDPDQTGSIVVPDVEDTTSWTLNVSNDFGSDSASVTAFFGPVIEVFEINGIDALDAGTDRDDAVEIATGDADLEWETFDADDTSLEYGDLDAEATSCDEVNGWTEIATGGADDSHLEAGISQNGCFRLTASNPQQSSSVTVFVRNFPYVSAAITTSESSVSGEDGGSVTISTSVFGAESVTFRARYYDDSEPGEEDEPSSTELLESCTESGIGSEAVEDNVSCSHVMSGRTCDGVGVGGACLGWSYDPPQGTELVEYEVCVFDANGDSSCDLTEPGENVEIN